MESAGDIKRSPRTKRALLPLDGGTRLIAQLFSWDLPLAELDRGDNERIAR